MSFRLFVYWCALCGGWAAVAGWALGRLAAGPDPLGSAGVKGLCLGLLIAFGLGLVDSLWVHSFRQLRRVAPRVLACTAVGTVGGLAGGFAGQLLFEKLGQTGTLFEVLGWALTWSAFLTILGWALTGFMVGISIGTFDLLRYWVREEDLHFALRKVVRGALGGTIGGLLGGFLYTQSNDVLGRVLANKPDLWAPSATGFVALGLCIGLLIGVAQVVLKQAWLRVEVGFRKGRELLLNKPVLTVGRAEACDIGLFGDPTVDRLHARILRRGDRYLIADAGSAGGTYVNDVRVLEPVPLRSGDLIGLGNARLRFRERQKRPR